MKWLLTAVIIALVILHQDFWLWRDHTLVFGFLPIGLVYHMGYCVAASLAMAALVRYAWPSELEQTPAAEHPCEGRRGESAVEGRIRPEHPNT